MLLTAGRENQREVQKQHCPVGVAVDYLLAARKRPAGNIMMIRIRVEVLQHMASLILLGLWVFILIMYCCWSVQGLDYWLSSSMFVHIEDHQVQGLRAWPDG